MKGFRINLKTLLGLVMYNQSVFPNVSFSKSYDKLFTFSVVACQFWCAAGFSFRPITFLLYINDIQGVVQHSSVKVLADDVALCKEVLSLSDCVQLQEDLNSILLWAICWQLHLNPSKCEALLISKKRNPVKAPYVLGESFILLLLLLLLMLYTATNICWCT